MGILVAEEAEGEPMYPPAFPSLKRIFGLAVFAAFPLALTAQVVPSASGPGQYSDKWDIFAGYSYLDPFGPQGTITGTTPYDPGHTYGEVDWGEIFSITRNLNQNFGIQFEGDSHIEEEEWPPGSHPSSFNTNDDFAGAEGGVLFRLPRGRFAPFVHALGGYEEVGSLYQPEMWGPVGTAGFGVDWQLGRHRLAWRVGQADYQFIHADSSNINTLRLSTGIVFHIGMAAPNP